MNKRKIQQLVEASYTNNQLDKEKIEKIVDMLNRYWLKQYIKGLKTEERKRTVVISSVKALTDQERSMVESLFPKKKIMYIIDPGLLMGLKIVDNDIEYEYNLKNTLDNLVEHITH